MASLESYEVARRRMEASKSEWIVRIATARLRAVEGRVAFGRILTNAAASACTSSQRGGKKHRSDSGHRPCLCRLKHCLLEYTGFSGCRGSSCAREVSSDSSGDSRTGSSAKVRRFGQPEGSPRRPDWRTAQVIRP